MVQARDVCHLHGSDRQAKQRRRVGLQESPLSCELHCQVPSARSSLSRLSPRSGISGGRVDPRSGGCVEVSLLAESESDDGIDSDDEEDEYEHYEKLVTTRILVGFDLETLNHCLVCYGCEPERRRRVAAKELARQLLQETDSEDSE